MPKVPRNKRVPDAPAMRLTDRDTEIIKAVHDFRVMRSDQIEALFFGSQSTASYRLLRLYQHEYLDRHFLPTFGGLASSPALYTIGKYGVGVLRKVSGMEPKEIRRRPSKQQLSPLFLEHTLKINDIRVAVTLAARDNGYKLEQWLDDTTLKADYDRVIIEVKSGVRREVSLIPDSYFVLQVPQGRTCFFLEFDRGTMTTARFREKVQAYSTYVASGQYERRYQTRSLRVLVVTTSRQRLHNLKRVTQEVSGGQMFWFAEFGSIDQGSVLSRPIWHTTSNRTIQATIELRGSSHRLLARLV